MIIAISMTSVMCVVFLISYVLRMPMAVWDHILHKPEHAHKTVTIVRHDGTRHKFIHKHDGLLAKLTAWRAK